MIIVSKINRFRFNKRGQFHAMRPNVYIIINGIIMDCEGLKLSTPFIFPKTRAPFIMCATFLISPTPYCWFSEASVAGVNVVSLIPIRRGCASVNRVNGVQGNQCARETRPVAERAHTGHSNSPFIYPLLSNWPVRIPSTPIQKIGAIFKSMMLFLSPTFHRFTFLYIYIYICCVHEWKLERRDSLKIVAPPRFPWRK